MHADSSAIFGWRGWSIGRWADLLSPAQTTDGWNHYSGVSEDEAGGEDSTVMVGEEEGEEAGIR